MKPSVCGVLIFAGFAFVACGGGGGGSSGGGSSTIVPPGTPTPTPTSTPTNAPTVVPLTVTGSAQEYASGAALAGFTVTVGALPNAATCLTGESATSMPCGVPSSPLPTVTTSANGSFSIAVPAAGTYMLTIGKDATYATLHRTITVAAATPLNLGALKVAALSSDEQAWVVDINTQRATAAVPVSFANLAVDEYAEEQARAEVAAIVSGAQPYGDATEELYNGYYYASVGTIYGAGSVAALVGASSAFLSADQLWMAEKSNCVGGNWQTCSFAEDTGHYVNVSSTGDVWLGVGESPTSYSVQPYGSEWAYAIIFPGDNSTTLPELFHRGTSAQITR